MLKYDTHTADFKYYYKYFTQVPKKQYPIGMHVVYW